MKTKQELFDISLNHIRQQGGPSVNKSGGCVYRSKDGFGCAAAPFINEYVPEMEDHSWGGLCGAWPDHLDPSAVEHYGFVSRLQWCHDASPINDFMSSYEGRMRRLAEREGLQYALEED